MQPGEKPAGCFTLQPQSIMGERIYRTEALILRRRNFGEADRLITLATPGGKRQVIAKGVRKTTSRIAGHIELFTHSSLLLAIGRNLDIITQSQVLQPFAGLHRELERLSCGYYIADLYELFTEPEEENQALFRLLVDTFTALDGSSNPDLVLRMYELRLLHIAGYRPQLHRCTACQALLSSEADAFSTALGGMLCPDHARTDPDALGIDAATFRLLRYLQREPFAALARLNISDELRWSTRQLLRTYLVRIVERDVKSSVFLDSLGPETLRPSHHQPGCTLCADD